VSGARKSKGDIQGTFNFIKGKSIQAKGVGGTITTHVQGDATKYISASETLAGTQKFDTVGVIVIDKRKLLEAGSGIVDHANVLQHVKKHGDSQDVKNVVDAVESLITRGIPWEAIVKIIQ
jgi:hypothetical protein